MHSGHHFLRNSLITIVFFWAFISSSFSQTAESLAKDYNLNTSDLINDINEPYNVHKPHDEYRYYVISGVFNELSNARVFMKKYRTESVNNEVFIFKEPQGAYYVAVEGPLKLEDAKQLAAKLNEQSNTKKLSDGNVWIFTKNPS